MPTEEPDNRAEAAPAGDTSRPTEPDYAALLGASEGLDIDEPEDADPEEGAADEGEGDEPDDSDGQDAKDAKPASDDVTVDVDGRKVTVRELTDTFRTFSRKAQEYAEADTAREVHARQAVATIQEQAAHQVAVMAQRINDLVLPGIDLSTIARVRQEDPAKAAELLTTLQIVEQFKVQMMAEANKLAAQSRQQREAADRKRADAMADLTRAEAEKLSAAKWFNDDFKAKAVKFLERHGIPRQAISQLNYAGAMEIINKAMRFDAAKKQAKEGKQPSQATQQVSASGKSRTPTTRQAQDAAFAAARKSGTRRDAARAYTSLLG